MRAVSLLLTLALLAGAGCIVVKPEKPEDPWLEEPLGPDPPPAAPPLSHYVAVEGAECDYRAHCPWNGSRHNECVAGMCHTGCEPERPERAGCPTGQECTARGLCESPEAGHPGSLCHDSFDCRGPSSLCLVHIDSGQARCGVACEPGARCPAGFACVDVGSGRHQCAPAVRCPEERGGC